MYESQRKGSKNKTNYDYLWQRGEGVWRIMTMYDRGGGGGWVSQILTCMTKGGGGSGPPKFCMTSYVNSSYLFILQYVWRKIFRTDGLELKCPPPAPAPLLKNSPNLCKSLESSSIQTAELIVKCHTIL